MSGDATDPVIRTGVIFARGKAVIVKKIPQTCKKLPEQTVKISFFKVVRSCPIKRGRPEKRHSHPHTWHMIKLAHHRHASPAPLANSHYGKSGRKIRIVSAVVHNHHFLG